MAKGFNIRAWLNLDTKDYEKGLSKAKRQTTQFASSMKKSMGGATKSIIGMFDRMTGGAVSGLLGMVKGLGAATKGMKLLKTALISSGIGALVVALGSLIAYFTSTQEGMEMVKKGMDALNAVFDALKSRVSAIGGALVKFFKGDFKGAVTDLKGAFEGLGDQIKDNYEQSIKTSEREIQLQKDKIALIVAEEQARGKMAELILKSRELEKYSAEQRKGFIMQAYAEELKLGEAKKKIAQEELALVQRRQAQGDNLLEDDKEAARLKAEILKLERAQSNAIREKQNRINTVNAELSKELKLQTDITDKIIDSINEELELDFDITPQFIGLPKIKEELKELQAAQALAASPEIWTAYQEKIKELNGDIEAFTGGVEEFADSGSDKAAGLAQAAEIMSGAFNQAGASVLGDISKMLGALASLISMLLAQGIAAQASLPFPANLAAMAGTLAAGVGVVASIPKFQDGGFLGGQFTQGDKQLFMGNTGEAILNTQQQKNFMEVANGGGMAGAGEWVIKGQDLVYIVNKYNKRLQNFN